MHRSERYHLVANGADILDLALALHGYYSGSLEAHPQQMEDVYEVLKEVVAGWQTIVVPNCAVFDNACLQVVLAALQEYDSMDDSWKPKLDKVS